MLVVVLVACLVVAAVLVLVLLWLGRGQDDERAKLERRFFALGKTLGAESTAGTLRVTAEGRTFVMLLRHGRSGKAGLEVETAAVSSADEAPASGGPRGRLPIVIRRETSIDRLGKKLRINREVQTGDAAFDAAVYVESDAPDEDVERVLGEARVRQHALALLDQGFSAVTIDERAGRLVAARDPGGEGLDAASLRAACGELATVAEAVPAPPKRFAPPALWLAGPMTAVVSAVSAFVGFYLVSWARAAYYPLGYGASVVGGCLGLFAWLFALPAVGALVRGRSVSFRLFGACFCLLLFAMPLSGAGLAVALNARMDQGAPALHHARVQSKGSRTYKQTTSYFVSLSGLSEETASVELPVERDVYAAVREGEDVVVEVGRGRFGWLWLKGIRRGGG